MRAIHFLLPDLGHCSYSRQVSLLAPTLQRSGRSVQVFSLSGPGPFSRRLASRGIPVAGPHGRRLIEPRSWLELRRHVADDAGRLWHISGLSALRAFRLATVGCKVPETIVALTGRESLSRLHHRLLRSVSRLDVPHEQAAAAVTAQGVPATKVRVVPPIVEAAPSAIDRVPLARDLGIDPAGPLLISAGQMRDPAQLGALWAFEFLRYPEQSAHLLMIGDGPAREKFEFLARGLSPEGSRVRFLGPREDVPALMGAADLVLLSQPSGGANVCLEAMAAGRAIVAVNSPDFAALIRHGESGMLVPIGAPAEIARVAYKLMHDSARREVLGSAARQAAARHQITSIDWL